MPIKPNFNNNSNHEHDGDNDSSCNKTPDQTDQYVLLVYTTAKKQQQQQATMTSLQSDDNDNDSSSASTEVIQRWREFSLPIQAHRVEDWCGLQNLRYYRITTSNNDSRASSVMAASRSLINNTKNKKKQKALTVYDDVEIGSKKLRHGCSYMVCGFTSSNSGEDDGRQKFQFFPSTTGWNDPDSDTDSDLSMEDMDGFNRWASSMSNNNNYFFQGSSSGGHSFYNDTMMDHDDDDDRVPGLEPIRTTTMTYGNQSSSSSTAIYESDDESQRQRVGQLLPMQSLGEEKHYNASPYYDEDDQQLTSDDQWNARSYYSTYEESHDSYLVSGGTSTTGGGDNDEEDRYSTIALQFVILTEIDYNEAVVLTFGQTLEQALINYYDSLLIDFDREHCIVDDMGSYDLLEQREHCTLNYQLILAASEGNTDRIELLLTLSKRAINPAYQTMDGMTAMMFAAKKGHKSILEMLLANPTAKTTIDLAEKEQNWTALHFAAGTNQEDCFRLLVESGASVCVFDKDGYSVLHLALCNKATDIVDTCLELVTKEDDMRSLNRPNNEGSTPVVLAIVHHHYSTAISMINKLEDLDLSIPDTDGYTPLIHAIKEEEFELVKCILNHPSGLATIDYRSRSGKTPLMYAASMDQLDVMEELLSHGADIDLRDIVRDFSAVMFALDHSNLQAARLLIANGCDVRSKYDDMTVAEFCTINGYIEVLEQLVEAGVDINIGNEESEDETTHVQDTLLLAISSNDVDKIRQLLQSSQVDANKKHEITGETPLHRAAANGNPEIITLLLSLCSDINIQDTFGRTPLHVARYCKHLAVADELTQMGADETIRDLSGVCPCAIFPTTECILVDQAKVTKIQHIGPASPIVPQGQLYQASFNNQIVELTEYTIATKEEAIDTCRRLVLLQQRLPKLYNHILPSTEKQQKADASIYSLFPRIHGFYFHENTVGIIQDLPTIEAIPFDIHSTEGRSVSLKMDLSIQVWSNLAILHSIGLTHGNIRKNNALRTSDGYVLFRNFALPCIADHFGQYNTIAPEVVTGGYKAISTKADVYSCAVIIFEMIMQQEYNKDRTSYDNDSAKNLVPEKTWRLIGPYLRPDVEIRNPDARHALELFLAYKADLISTPLSDDADEIMKELQYMNVHNTLATNKFIRTKCDAYSFNDHRERRISFEANNQISKCIAKIKETIEGIVHLTTEETTALQNLDQFLSTNPSDPSAASQFTSEATYSLIHKLLTQMPDQFMALDLFRLFVLNSKILPTVLSAKHVHIVDELLNNARDNYANLSVNSKLMLNRLLCNISADASGRAYLSSTSEKRSIIAGLIGRGLILKGDNEKSVGGVRVTAAALALNMRLDIHKPAIDCDGVSLQLNDDTRKLVLAILFSLKAAQPVFAEDIIHRLSVTLYSLLKQDDLILSLVLSRKDFKVEELESVISAQSEALSLALKSLLALPSAQITKPSVLEDI